MEVRLDGVRAHAILAFSKGRTSAARCMRMLAFLVVASPAVATAAVQAEGECAPLAQMVRRVATAGYVRVLYANEIASEPASIDGIVTRGAGSPRIRMQLESLVAMSLDAGTHAEQAVEDGRLASGREEHFVAEVRRRTYAALQAHRSRAEWLEMLVDPSTRKGIVLARHYVFPRQGAAGLMNGAEQMCVRNRLEQVALWPKESPTSHPRSGGPEQPDCGFASRSGVSCAGMGSQVERAVSQGESVIATATNGAALMVYTFDPMSRRGRVLRVSSNGTALLEAWLFNIDIPAQ